MFLVMIPSAMATSDAQITRNTEFQPNSTSYGYYNVTNPEDVNLTEINYNATHVIFTGLTGSQRGIRNAITFVSLCASNSVNCSLEYTDTLVHIVFTNAVPDINLSFGPPNTSIFRYLGCGPAKENATSQPENQTTTYGIDKLCNNVTYTNTTIQIMINGSLNRNWTLYASNTSIVSNLITLVNNSWKTIYSGLLANTCTYIWHLANCSYIAQNPGIFIDYRTS